MSVFAQLYSQYTAVQRRVQTEFIQHDCLLFLFGPTKRKDRALFIFKNTLVDIMSHFSDIKHY